MTSGRIVSR